jgi:hypothetical protein
MSIPIGPSLFFVPVHFYLDTSAVSLLMAWAFVHTLAHTVCWEKLWRGVLRSSRYHHAYFSLCN